MKKIILLVIVFFNIFPYISNKTVSMVGVQSAMAEIGSEKGEKKPILADTSTKKSTTDTSTNKNDTSKVHVYQTVTVVSGGTGGSSGGGGVTTSGGTVGGTLTGSATSGTGSTDLGSSTQNPPPSTNTSTPCDDAKKDNNLFKRKSIPQKQHDQIQKNTTKNEYGAEVKLAAFPPGNTPTFKDVAVHPNSNPSTNTFTPNFTWNSTDGYTIGSDHGHPGNTGPSPADLVNAHEFLSNSDLVAGGKDAIDYFKDNFTTTITTDDATYIVRVTDWDKLGKLYDDYYKNAESEKNGNDDYQLYRQECKNKDPDVSLGDQSVYAALKLYGNAISIAKGDGTASDFTPMKIADGHLASVPCPN